MSRVNVYDRGLAPLATVAKDASGLKNSKWWQQFCRSYIKIKMDETLTLNPNPNPKRAWQLVTSSKKSKCSDWLKILHKQRLLHVGFKNIIIIGWGEASQLELFGSGEYFCFISVYSILNIAFCQQWWCQRDPMFVLNVPTLFM